MSRSSHCTSGLLILFLASLTVLGESTDKPTKAKRVFTNEDLGRFREKYGSDATAATATEPSRPADGTKEPEQKAPSPKSTTPESKAYWIAKLKETDSALEKAKAQELKFHGIVEKFEQKLRDAKGEFHTRTSQEQLADSMKNLSRAKEEAKQAEEAKAKLLAQAAEKGFNSSDLREEPAR